MGPYSLRVLLVGTVAAAIGGLGLPHEEEEADDVEGDGGSLVGAKVGLGGIGEGSCHRYMERYGDMRPHCTERRVTCNSPGIQNSLRLAR